MAETRTLQLDPDLAIALDEAGNGRPALVLHGGGGPATVAGIAAHLSDAMRVLTPTHPGWNGTDRPDRIGTIVELAGHLPHVEQPAATYAVLDTFLATEKPV
jgi:hypothetical protein